MFDTTPTSRGRLVAAACLVLGALCWLASSIASPAWADDTGAYLAEIAASPDAHIASGALFLAGAILVLPGLVAVSRTFGGPRGLVGRAGAWLLAVGALVGGGLGLAVNVFETTLARSELTRAQMVAISDGSEDSAAAMAAFLGVFLGGFVLGLVLLGVGLALRRAWLSALLVLAPVVLLFAAGEGKTGSIVGIAVLVAAFAALARRVAVAADEPDAPQGARAASRGLRTA